MLAFLPIPIPNPGRKQKMLERTGNTVAANEKICHWVGVEFHWCRGACKQIKSCQFIMDQIQRGNFLGYFVDQVPKLKRIVEDKRAYLGNLIFKLHISSRTTFLG